MKIMVNILNLVYYWMLLQNIALPWCLVLAPFASSQWDQETRILPGHLHNTKWEKQIVYDLRDEFASLIGIEMNLTDK